MVLDAASESWTWPVAVVLAGGYAYRSEDTVTIHTGYAREQVVRCA